MSPPLIGALAIEADDEVGIQIGLREGTTKQKVARLVIRREEGVKRRGQIFC